MLIGKTRENEWSVSWTWWFGKKDKK